MDADFSKLFEYAYAYAKLRYIEKKELETKSWNIKLSETTVSVDYTQGLPECTLSQTNKSNEDIPPNELLHRGRA